jgi:hypothetical protein
LKQGNGKGLKVHDQKFKFEPFFHIFAKMINYLGGRVKHMVDVAIIIILRNGEGKGRNSIIY